MITKTPNAKWPIKFTAVDVSDGQIYGMIRSWNEDGSSDLLFAGYLEPMEAIEKLKENPFPITYPPKQC